MNILIGKGGALTIAQKNARAMHGRFLGGVDGG